MTPDEPSLRISGLPPRAVVGLWRGLAVRVARADGAGTARFDPAEVPAGRYVVTCGFPEPRAAGVVDVRTHPEPGVEVVADALFPLDPGADGR